MGLFGSHRRNKKATETSIRNNYNSTPAQSTPSSLDYELEQKNEAAAVTTRVTEQVVEPVVEESLENVSRETIQEESLEVSNTQEENNENSSLSEQEDIPEEKPEITSFRNKPPVDHIIGQTKIFSIINQKGGVGKSTTAVNLAASLGASGKEVLLVDLDPQGNTTSGYGINKRDLNACVYDVLLGETAVEDVIVACVGKHVDVLPATINLAGAEVELVNEMARENRLKNALGSLRGRYDYILIDCPPSLGLLTINALVASDKLLVPIQCEFYALEGVTKLLDSMKRVKSMLNPSLDIVGIVMTMFDSRTNLSKQVVEEVRAFFGNAVFKTVIPRTVKLSEAPSYGQPINEYAPDNKGAIAYDNLAKEVISRG